MVSLGRPLVWCISSPSCHQRQFGPVLKTASFSFALSWSCPSQHIYFTFSHEMLIRTGWSSTPSLRSFQKIYSFQCKTSQTLWMLSPIPIHFKFILFCHWRKIPNESTKRIVIEKHNYWRSSKVSSSSQITLVNQICGYGVLHEDDSVSSMRAL